MATNDVSEDVEPGAFYNKNFDGLAPPEISVVDENNVVLRDRDSNGRSGHSKDQHETAEYKEESKKLRKYLKLYLYSAVKWKDGVCSIHLIYLFLFLWQITKVGLITGQIFNFGSDRANFSSIVNRGHLALRHLLLKNWDASWETLPYPPAQGDFAVYSIDELVEWVNFAVSQFYNAEEEAIGYYVRRPDDVMFFRLRHFDFPGFQTSDLNGGVNIVDGKFPIKHGLHTNESTGHYTYDVLEEFEHLNLSEPIKRLLSMAFDFTIHSVRVHATDASARCLRIKGEVWFKDLDNNGQVLVNLDTLTTRITCAEMGLQVTDWELANTSKGVGIAVLLFCLISLVATLTTISFATFLCLFTKRFMKKHYQTFYQPVDPEETDLPFSEYFHFVKLWDIVVIASDTFTLIGTIEINFLIPTQEWVLETLDKETVALGIGCVLAWINLLRYFKFHNKFHLLFSTLYGAAGDVLAYLVCVSILFLGFWVCGYVVMGPYHVKFKTPERAMETLFSVINGDEIYATMATLEDGKSGGKWVFWFSRIYIGAYVAIFTIVVINLLIAIFMSSYEAIKEYYETKPEERDLTPMEKALRRYLLSEQDTSKVRSSVCNLLVGTDDKRSSEERELRRALSKIVRVGDVGSQTTKLVFMKPRTLKAFLEDEDTDRRLIDFKFLKVSFALFSDKDK